MLGWGVGDKGCAHVGTKGNAGVGVGDKGCVHAGAAGHQGVASVYAIVVRTSTILTQ